VLASGDSFVFKMYDEKGTEIESKTISFTNDGALIYKEWKFNKYVKEIYCTVAFTSGKTTTFKSIDIAYESSERNTNK